MEGTGSFVCSSRARVLLATPRKRVLLSCSYGPMVWRGGNLDGLITCWIKRCTRQCYRCVQHLYLLPTIHHRSRSWHQCQAHACGMHDSHAYHNTHSPAEAVGRAMLCLLRRYYPVWDHPRHENKKGYYVGPVLGSRSIMDRVYARAGNSRAVTQFRHVLVAPALAQKHAMLFHLYYAEDTRKVDPLHERTDAEATDEKLCVHDCDELEQQPYSDEPFMEELKNLELFDSVRAGPLDPPGAAVVVHAYLLPWG